MFKSFLSIARGRRMWAVPLGMTILALSMVAPAGAATISPGDCAALGGDLAVRLVASSPGQTIVLSQEPDLYYRGDGTAEVFCRRKSDGFHLGGIGGSKVKITINADAGAPGVINSSFAITGLSGVPAVDVNPATPGNPVLLGPFDGTAAFRVTAPSSLLGPDVIALAVGTHIEIVAEAFGGPLIDPITGVTLKPGTFGDVLAQTPELGSLALFGAGAAGMAGYAVARFRARRRG